MIEKIQAAPVPSYYRGMTPAQFKEQIAKATTRAQLRAIVTEFVPTFATLSHHEQNLLRKKWKARQEELGVRV